VFFQAVDLAKQLPQYKDNIRLKVESLQHRSHGTLGEASEGLKKISEEVLSTGTQPQTQPAQAALPVSKATVPATRPMPVEIAEKPPTAWQAIVATITPLLAPPLQRSAQCREQPVGKIVEAQKPLLDLRLTLPPARAGIGARDFLKSHDVRRPVLMHAPSHHQWASFVAPLT